MKFILGQNNQKQKLKFNLATVKAQTKLNYIAYFEILKNNIIV